MSTDIDAWRAFVADCQACVRTKAAHGMTVITVRLCAKDGELTEWSAPNVQRWHSEHTPWAKERIGGKEG